MLRVAYTQNSLSIFGLDSYSYGTLLDGRHGNETSYRYGFNGMRKDDEIKNISGSSYDYGARMYDPRVGRFLSLDPKAAVYPFMSPYCYAANSPIYFTDENGEGPLSTMLRIATWGQRMIAKWTGTIVQIGLNAKIMAGLGFTGAGAVAGGGIAVDKHGNIGLYWSKSAFANFIPGSGNSVSTDDADHDHDVILLGEVTIEAELKFTSGDNVIEIAGESRGTPNIATMDVVDVKGKLGVGGGVSFDGNSFGLSIGLGFGACVSTIANTTFVIAYNIKDVVKYENAIAKIARLKKHGYKEKYSTFVDDDGFTHVYAKMEKTITKGKNKTKTKTKEKDVTLLSIKKDRDRNAIYTKYVKRK